MREKVTLGKIWGLIYPMLIYVGLTFVVGELFGIAFSILLKANGYDNNALEEQLYRIMNEQLLMITFVAAVLTIPIMGYLMYRDTQRDRLNGRYARFKGVFFLKYLLIIPFAVVAMYASNMIVEILVMFMPKSMVDTYASTAEALYGSSIWLQVLTGGIFGPIVEELIFRGLIYKRIKRMSGVVVAAIISSILFGVFHWNWVQAPYAALIGLACVFVYERYKNIIAPILFHISANMCSIMLSLLIDQGKQSESISTNTNIAPWQQFLIVIMLAAISGLMTVGMVALIKKTVNPKEA